MISGGMSGAKAMGGGMGSPMSAPDVANIDTSGNQGSGFMQKLLSMMRG